MRIHSRVRSFLLVAAAAALAALMAISGCISEPGSEGIPIQGGTDTETLTGLMLTAQGELAPGIQVKLIPSGYDPRQPDSSWIRVAVTDSKGRYRFPKAKAAGSYNLLAVTGEDAVFREALPSDSVPDTLRLESTRKFYFTMYGDIYDYTPGRVWFPGTDIMKSCGTDYPMTMDGLPRGMNAVGLESDAGWRYDVTITVPDDSLWFEANRYQVRVLRFQ